MRKEMQLPASNRFLSVIKYICWRINFSATTETLLPGCIVNWCSKYSKPVDDGLFFFFFNSERTSGIFFFRMEFAETRMHYMVLLF